MIDRFPEVPARIDGLRELACNLWWSWHHQARDLFNMLNPAAWQLSVHNPVKLLHEIDRSVLERAAENEHFLRHYDAVISRFRSEMRAKGGWFPSHIRNPTNVPIAYFSAEYGLHHSMPFYAGGLGFLAGDYLKECSDLMLPVIGVGFMYPGGYLRQRLSPDGWQLSESEILDKSHAPISQVLDENGKPLLVRVPVIEPPIYVGVWKLRIGRIPLYLLDTDVEANDPWNRGISSRLYIGDAEQRLRQEIVLGIGGMSVLESMGINNLVLHLNEGHPAFAVLERLRSLIGSGMSCRDAIDYIRSTTVFTTHTPVPAGHDIFPFHLMEKYFNSYLPSIGLTRDQFFRLGIDPANPQAGFNMTAFAMRMSLYRNCVSRRHLEVTESMWRHLISELKSNGVVIDYVTNGVHILTWLDRGMEDLFNRYLGLGWLEEHDDPSIWALVDEIPDRELWMAHRMAKMRLITTIRERARLRWAMDGADPRIIVASGVLFDPSVFTIGFARRFATYKRATLVLQDLNRLRSILNNEDMPVQIIFAGKAHPADDTAKQIIQRVYNVAKDPSFGGRIAFVEDYDEQLAQYMVHGVDLWLNTPQPPLEASGTSGMKAMINGVPQLSVLDGWWIEGYNGRNGWAFEGAEGADRDVRDAHSLYDLLENDIVPLFYSVENNDGVPHGWVRVMKEAIKSTAPRFSARRMVKEYTGKFYVNALDAANSFSMNGTHGSNRTQLFRPE
ncbi:MAG: alpha-glucan family phosphorylase [Methanothrix sp.]